MSETRYTRDHEWMRIEDGVATIGITDYAQTQLGDIVFVELPAPNTSIEAGAEAAVVESVERQKASQRAHLDELETLFASLQSRAFRGEL